MPLGQRRVDYPLPHADAPAPERSAAPRVSHQAGSSVEKWSARRTLALIVGATLVLWVMLIAAVAAIVRALV